MATVYVYICICIHIYICVKTPVSVWVDVWALDPGLVFKRVSLVGFWLPGLTLVSAGDEQFGVAWGSLCLGEVLSEGTLSGGCLDLTLPSGTGVGDLGDGEKSGVNGGDPDTKGLGGLGDGALVGMEVEVVGDTVDFMFVMWQVSF